MRELACPAGPTYSTVGAVYKILIYVVKMNFAIKPKLLEELAENGVSAYHN
jgi:hypothetical protein